jgi:hypothetical protein
VQKKGRQTQDESQETATETLAGDSQTETQSTEITMAVDTPDATTADDVTPTQIEENDDVSVDNFFLAIV